MRRRRPPRFGPVQVDPVGPLLAVLAAVVYWLHGFQGYLSRDLGLYAYAGQQVADGVPPYEGVVNRSGPLSHLVPGLGAALGRLVGVDDVRAMRVLFLVLSVASIWLAYRLGRDLFGSRIAGAATAAALLCVTGFIQYASDGPREKTTMVLLMLLAALAVVHRRPGWAGCFVALATLTWQPAFFVGVTTALVGLWALPRGRRLRGLGAIAVGGLAPLAGFVVWYAAIGHLRDFLDCFVLIHVRYTQQPPLADEVDQVWEVMREVYDASLWVMIVGACALLAGSVAGLVIRSRREDPASRVLVAFGAGLVAGVLWCLKAFNGWPDIFFMLPVVCCGIGYLARELVDRVPRSVALGLGLGWLALTTVWALDFSLHEQDDDLTVQQASVDGVMAVLPPDATIVSIEAPQPLVLSGKTDPLRHQMFTDGLDAYVDATWPGGLTGLGDDVRDLDPTVIAVGTTHQEWLDPVLAEGYTEIGTAPGWTWYLDSSVGPDVLGAAREAATAARAGSGSAAEPQ